MEECRQPSYWPEPRKVFGMVPREEASWQNRGGVRVISAQALRLQYKRSSERFHKRLEKSQQVMALEDHYDTMVGNNEAVRMKHLPRGGSHDRPGLASRHVHEKTKYVKEPPKHGPQVKTRSRRPLNK
eukprot:SRR837773.12773.p1 GENE.SRR837773.12773~~SRR837773.12773.p1  ORF type:complete len:142 (+),score=20.41 SRR837773.12773:43-426(+)